VSVDRTQRAFEERSRTHERSIGYTPGVSRALLNSRAAQPYRATVTADPEPPKSDTKAWYAWYLRTDAWDQKRRAVLRRANYCCEGCGIDNRKLHVHHLTYAHKGNEFLFELVAVCEVCHERCHAQ
jgi:5-methylcytosine-specific restriction endonuclease McrA